MPLCSVDTLKTFFSVASSVTTYNALFEQLAGWADRAIKAYCGLDLEETDYPGAAPNGRGDTGYYSGNGQRRLVTRQLPIHDNDTLAIYSDPTGRHGDNPDGSFASDTLLELGSDYEVDWDGCLPGTTTRCSYSGIIWRLGTVWTDTRESRVGNITSQRAQLAGNIKIVYTAGYPTIPGDLEAAACELVAWIRRNGPKGGQFLASESLGSYSYSMAQMALNSAPELGSTRQLLSAYRDVRLW